VACRQYTTIPIDRQIQALWSHADGAKALKHRDRKTWEILSTLKPDGTPLIYDDIYSRSDYLEAVAGDKIASRDILLDISIDGAQLYQDKQSDAWFIIGRNCNLPPTMCYKRDYVILIRIIPGPKNPWDLDSFLLPIFQHIKDWQTHGLKIWDADSMSRHTSQIILGYGLACEPGGYDVSTGSPYFK
jgi:hypothetical protein